MSDFISALVLEVEEILKPFSSPNYLNHNKTTVKVTTVKVPDQSAVLV